MPIPPPDNEVVAALNQTAAGSSSAEARLFDWINEFSRPVVLRRISERLGASYTWCAEHGVQEGSVVLVEKARAGEIDPHQGGKRPLAAIAGFFYVIAYRKALSELRGPSAVPLDGDLPAADVDIDVYLDLQDAMRKLSPEQQLLIMRRYVDGTENQVLAREAGVAPSTMSERIKQIALELRALLEETPSDVREA